MGSFYSLFLSLQGLLSSFLFSELIASFPEQGQEQWLEEGRTGPELDAVWEQGDNCPLILTTRHSQGPTLSSLQISIPAASTHGRLTAFKGEAD